MNESKTTSEIDELSLSIAPAIALTKLEVFKRSTELKSLKIKWWLRQSNGN